MTRAKPRTHLHSSRLMRFLADLSLVDAVVPANAFAEKLGLWVGFTDAIQLSSVHAAKPQPASPCLPPDSGQTLLDEVARMRAGFAQSIRPVPQTGSSKKMGRARIEWPEPSADLPLNAATAYEPYRRFYMAHQRDMELKISLLRNRVRELLMGASPALQKLAALDSALDTILREREGALLGTVPVILKSRFVQLFTTHQHDLANTQQADNPANWAQPGGWLARFCGELETALLAEWDVRLEPTQGLIDALHHEIALHP